MDSAAHLERLYKRFIADMNQPLSSRYYDEDELIDIFDYASDQGDDAVRMEVVLLGDLLFPGSIDIAERKAVLYWSMGNNEAASKVISKIPGKHFLTKLLQLRIKKSVGQLDENDFTRLVKGVKPGSMDDEEVIQMIDAAADAGQQQWLIDHYELLKSLAQYPETVMYDTVTAVVERDREEDFEFVNKVLDDLTMASPYDVGYWEYAADIAMSRQNDPERALGYVEYALAINPKSQKSLILKTDALLALNQPKIHEAVEVAKSAYILYPDSSTASLAYAHALQVAQKMDEAMVVLKNHLTLKDCDLAVAVPICLFDKEADAGQLIRDAVKNVDPSRLEIQLDGLVSKFTSIGDFEHLAQAMEVVEELGFGRNYNPEFMVELYFRTDRWEKTLPYIAECHPMSHNIWLLTLIMSLPAPEGENPILAIDAKIVEIDRTIATGTMSEVTQGRAVKAYLLKIREALVSGTVEELDRYNPFDSGLSVLQ